MAYIIVRTDSPENEHMHADDDIQADIDSDTDSGFLGSKELSALPEDWIKSHSCWNYLRPKRLKDHFEQPLGLLSGLRSRTYCQLCQTIYLLVKERVRFVEVKGFPEDQILVEIVHSFSSKLLFRVRWDKWSSMLEDFQLCPVGDYPNGATLFDLEHIAVSDLRDWIRDCYVNHTSCNLVPAREDRTGNILVIDVIYECLREESLGTGFLTLSYVWGAQNTFRLTKANLQAFHVPGSFNPELSKLPQTIRDAITLTKELGYRYLWVDTICIVQDDEENKTKQIEQMTSIYANAIITIVAADGDHADYGLKGIGTSRSDSAPTVLDFGNGRKLVVNLTEISYQDSKSYFTRGWTYQEYHLSRRLLVFINGRAFFKCRESERQEGLNGIVYDWGYLPTPALKDSFGWPDLWRYLELVQEYNIRNLTYDNDVIAAFFGVLTEINGYFIGGFLHGLPAFYFDLALLWQPSEPLRRRVCKNPDISPPSWSWTGWAGELDLEICKAGIVYPPTGGQRPKLYDMEIAPILNWFHIDLPVSMVPTRIDNSYYHYYNLRVPNFTNKYETDSLERDFLTRMVEGSGLVSDAPESLKKYVQEWMLSACQYIGAPNPDWGLKGPWPSYKHKSLEDDYAYPLPVTDSQLTSLRSQESRYLSFQAERGYFLFGQALDAKELDQTIKCKAVAILDNYGSIVGALRLNFSNPPDLAGSSCELVAISRGKANLRGIFAACQLEEASDLKCLQAIARLYGGTTTYPKDPLAKDTPDQHLRSYIGSYEFYNVIWVERSGPVTYRRALGRVFRKAWESQPRQKVDIVLG